MNKKPILIISSFLILFWILSTPFSALANEVKAQQPTVSIPTVTGTAQGVTATVLLDQEDAVNVRSGPGVFFDKVGVLLPGQKVSVLGRSAGGDWVLVNYPGGPNNQGWIYSPVVSISPGELQIIEPPSTPTPEVTQTINPTLAAQFITTPNPTRLPTFTPSDPLVIPTYTDSFERSMFGAIPAGLVIMLLAGIGGLLALISYIRSR